MANLIEVNFAKSTRTYHIGDPGRFLRPGVFQEMQDILNQKGCCPDGVFIFLAEDPETG